MGRLLYLRFCIIIIFIPKAIFTEIILNYTELYWNIPALPKTTKKKQAQNHSNNGNDIEEVIGVDKSILSDYKKHINKKYNNYTNSTTTTFLLKGCAAFFTTGKVSGWLAVHVSRENYCFFKKSKKSCTYITIILINRLWLKNGLQWKV